MDLKRRPKPTLSTFLNLRAQESSIPVNAFPSDKKEQISEPDDKDKSFTSSSSDDSDSKSSEEDPNKQKQNLSLNNSKREDSGIKMALNDQLISPLSHNQMRESITQTFNNPAIRKLKEKNKLDTPDFLKEFKYKRKSQLTIVKEGPNNESKEIHQMSQFSYIRDSARSSSSVGTTHSQHSPKANDHLIFPQKDEVSQKEGFESHV